MGNRLRTLQAFLKERPLNVIIWKMYCKISNGKIPDTELWISLIKNKLGLEIGGPSGIFSKHNYLPIYPNVRSLDGVNFSDKTIWEGEVRKGNNYKYGDKSGFQFIADGTHLKEIQNDVYDFVLSSNNLEHIANPIKSLLEWKRVIKPGGSIILILPRKESNFDHARQTTTFKHIRNDFENIIHEDDLTHLSEILDQHDLKRDPHAGSYEAFKKRSLNNFENRSLHHHVFDMEVLKQLVNFIDMKFIIGYSSPTDHFIAARK